MTGHDTEDPAPAHQSLQLTNEKGDAIHNPPWQVVERIVRELNPGHFNSYACLSLPGNTYVQCLHGFNGWQVEWRTTDPFGVVERCGSVSGVAASGPRRLAIPAWADRRRNPWRSLRHSSSRQSFSVHRVCGGGDLCDPVGLPTRAAAPGAGEFDPLPADECREAA